MAITNKAIIEAYKDDKGNMINTGRCFHKTMSLFEMSQVERMI